MPLPRAGGIVHADQLYDGPHSYTPALTASTTNPTLGAGAVQDGQWYRIGSLVKVWVRIVFGNSGVNAGSGSYRISLPTDAPADGAGMFPSGSTGLGTPVGSGVTRDNNNLSASITLAAHLITSTTVLIMSSTGGLVANAVPWTWAAEDGLSLEMTYLTDI